MLTQHGPRDPPLSSVLEPLALSDMSLTSPWSQFSEGVGKLLAFLSWGTAVVLVPVGHFASSRLWWKRRSGLFTMRDGLKVYPTHARRAKRLNLPQKIQWYWRVLLPNTPCPDNIPVTKGHKVFVRVRRLTEPGPSEPSVCEDSTLYLSTQSVEDRHTKRQKLAAEGSAALALHRSQPI